jgi:hypothetical protein
MRHGRNSPRFRGSAGRSRASPLRRWSFRTEDRFFRPTLLGAPLRAVKAFAAIEELPIPEPALRFAAK